MVRLNVPFIKQKTDYCGPAVLAMTMKYHGVQADHVHLGDKLGAAYFGATLGELQDAAIERGFNASIRTDMSIEELVGFIDCNLPVILLQEISLQNPGVHYRLAIGYDDKRMIVHDPDLWPEMEINKKIFSKLWRSQGFERVGLILRPKKELLCSSS